VRASWRERLPVKVRAARRLSVPAREAKMTM